MMFGGYQVAVTKMAVVCDVYLRSGVVVIDLLSRDDKARGKMATRSTVGTELNKRCKTVTE